MITRITINDCVEAKPHHFVAEASTLGWKPGTWPDRVETDLGNRLPFILDTYETKDGDLLWVRYQQANGCIGLRVFND